MRYISRSFRYSWAKKENYKTIKNVILHFKNTIMIITSVGEHAENLELSYTPV